LTRDAPQAPDGNARLTRRGVLRWLLGLTTTAAAGTAYATIIEPGFRLNVRLWRPRPANWPQGRFLRIVVLADLHAGEPWMSAVRIRSIVDTANSLEPDLVLLLGDYVATHRFVTNAVPGHVWAAELARLRPRLAIAAVLGNHDWWMDEAAQRRRAGPTMAGQALEAVGIRLLENDAMRIGTGADAVWLAGLADQIAFLKESAGWFEGLDDLPATLARVSDDAPVILMAHEPDIFPQVPPRVALTISGHTHGGQVRLFGWSPLVPSRFGNRYAYGHVVEAGRHLVVSGGLGLSTLPIRFGVPPEIVVVELGA
jgi:predicted MPP superfamily phosphohydrolase